MEGQMKRGLIGVNDSAVVDVISWEAVASSGLAPIDKPEDPEHGQVFPAVRAVDRRGWRNLPAIPAKPVRKQQSKGSKSS
jgi:hypothetical protein